MEFVPIFPHCSILSIQVSTDYPDSTTPAPQVVRQHEYKTTLFFEVAAPFFPLIAPELMVPEMRYAKKIVRNKL